MVDLVAYIFILVLSDAFKYFKQLLMFFSSVERMKIIRQKKKNKKIGNSMS